MRNETVEFQWDVHEGGYWWIETITVDEDKESGSFLTNGRPIGARGFAVVRYTPLALHTGLFRVFAEVEPTQEGVKVFADRFGPLGGIAEDRIILPNEQTEKGEPVGMGERLAVWHREILTMRRAVDLWTKARKGDAEGLAPFIEWNEKGIRYVSHRDLGPREQPEKPFLRTTAIIATEGLHDELLERFRPGDVVAPAFTYVQRIINERLKGSSPRLLSNQSHSGLGFNIVPGSLLAALWLQFALAIEHDSDFRKCIECDEMWFERSPRTARADKKYCSDGCRMKAYRKRRDSTVS